MPKVKQVNVRHKIIVGESSGPFLAQFYEQHGINDTNLARNNLIWRMATYDPKIEHYCFWITHIPLPSDRHDTVSSFCITKLDCSGSDLCYVWRLTNWHSTSSPIPDLFFAHAYLSPQAKPMAGDVGLAVQQDQYVRSLLINEQSFRKGHIRTMKLFYTRITDPKFSLTRIYLRNPKVSILNQYFSVGILEEAISSVCQHYFSCKNSTNQSISIRPICTLAKEWAQMFFNSTVNERWQMILAKSLERVQIECPKEHVERLVVTELSRWDSFCKTNPSILPTIHVESLPFVDDWAFCLLN